MQERARRQVDGAPARAMSGRWRHFLRRPGRDGRAQRDRAPPLELQPESIDGAVVVQPHAGPAAALDEEEKGGLRAEWTEQRGAQRDDQAHHTREHLVHLWQVHRRAAAQSGSEPPWIPGSVVPALERDLERRAAAGEGQRAREIRRDRTPRVVTRHADGGAVAEHPVAEDLERGRGGEPRCEGGANAHGLDCTIRAHPMSHVGRPARRREDPPLLRGAGRFLDDLPLDAVAHVVFVRSPHAHARVTSLDVETARTAPGVVAVVSAADVDPFPPIGLIRAFEGMVLPAMAFLAGDVVRAQGTPVAAVVAETAALAVDAATLVRVEYTPLPGVADADVALAPGAPPVIGGADNRSFTYTVRAGEPDAAFASADRVVSLDVRQTRLAGVPLEPRGVAARWADGALTVWSSTQVPHRIRDELARLLALPAERVRVIAPDVGGGFGVKGGPYREEILIPWLARRLGRPLKWIATRLEDLLTTHHGRGSVSRGELAVTADGRIVGLRAHIACPLGPHVGYTAAGTPRNHVRCLPGPYAVTDVDIEARGAFTTTPPIGPYRGAGRPEAAFLMERLVDEAARVLALDPAEVRRRNLVPPEKFPFATATGQSYDSGDYPAMLERVLDAIDYPTSRHTQAVRRGRGELVGIGLSVYVEPSALGWESGLVRVTADGRVTAVTGSSAHGQGHETTFAQVLADRLMLEPEAITVEHGDTARIATGVGTFGSRSVALGGGALVHAADAVVAKARRLAAHLLEAHPDDVRLAAGGFGVAGVPGRFLTWADVARLAWHGSLPVGEARGLEASHVLAPEHEVWSGGAVAAMVSIEPDTGQWCLERLVWVDDAGTIVNPLLADGQLEGSLAQAWGQIAMEAMRFDADGHVLTGTLMDYAIPRADDVPHAEIHHAHSPTPRNPLGAKGLGEAGNIGVPPAVVNAVVDALAPLGVRHIDMPLTPESIWRVMH
jgi:aerobic carbon-monoxide dehydrogenase large subunit